MSSFEDVGLPSFLKKVCISTAGALLLTGTTSALAIKYIPQDVVSDKALLIGGAVLGIGSMIAVVFQKTKYRIEGRIVVPEYSIAQKILFPTFFISEGLAIAPLARYAMEFSPSAIPISLCVTGATVAGMITYALSRPKGSLLKWGAPLHIMSWGLVATGLIAAFTRNAGIEVISCGLGIIMFAGATAHDVHAAADAYSRRQPDHMMHAITFYLDFMNMFIRVLEVFWKIEEEKANSKKKRYVTYLSRIPFNIFEDSFFKYLRDFFLFFIIILHFSSPTMTYKQRWDAYFKLVDANKSEI